MKHKIFTAVPRQVLEFTIHLHGVTGQALPTEKFLVPYNAQENWDTQTVITFLKDLYTKQSQELYPEVGELLVVNVSLKSSMLVWDLVEEIHDEFV